MRRSIISFLGKRCPWLLRLFLQRRWQREIERASNSGEFISDPDKLVHFSDYERSNLTRHIPLIFHQTWRTSQVPQFWRSNRDAVTRLHPTPPWEHRLWTDDEIAEFVAKHFPQNQKAFHLLPKPIMRIDMFRYMVLWVHGGVYADLDFRLFKPVDDLIADCTLLIPAESDNSAYHSFCGQYFLASCAQHPLWEDCVKTCLDCPTETILAYDDPLAATGPEFVTKVWRRDPEKYRAKIPMRVYLGPPSSYWYSGISPPALSYGIHQCHGTWR
jgi:mannosyltransferase OCH1-like enzyme